MLPVDPATSMMSATSPLVASRPYPPVMVSGVGKNGELSGVPKPQCVDLWANMVRCVGPDGIDIDLDRRIERAIEDGNLERLSWKKSRAA